MSKRAILSVSDKTGIVDFAKGLKKAGYEIISTGGTAKALETAGIDVISVESVTDFPECLNGRVKTLNPKIFAGILAMRSNAEHMRQLSELNCETIDIVCVNLYPFKNTIRKAGVTLEEAVENIDIGGPSMLRAAAKNWQDVAVVTDVEDYEKILSEIDNISKETKFYLATKVFQHTAAYDAMICDYLKKQSNDNELPEDLTLTYEKVQDLRYGENSHQKASFYKEIIAPQNSLAMAKQIHGK
ncbi:MAG: bifunctional phosphoribosylaminoimidazolecarboxamide formyltransferase/IMP cyclohydrolase, partial [Oscillospiraceae bacterium]